MRAMRSLRPRLGALGAGALVSALALASSVPSGAAVPKAKGPAAAAHAVLPWIVDDYPRAVAEAKARKVPIFVESWAPW